MQKQTLTIKQAIALVRSDWERRIARAAAEMAESEITPWAISPADLVFLEDAGFLVDFDNGTATRGELGTGPDAVVLDGVRIPILGTVRA